MIHKRSATTALFIVWLVNISFGLTASAQNSPRGRVNTIVYTNFEGPNHHRYLKFEGTYVGGANFSDQVIGQSFTTTSPIQFADAILAMGVEASPGGGTGGPIASVYLESDAEGHPGVILD